MGLRGGRRRERRIESSLVDGDSVVEEVDISQTWRDGLLLCVKWYMEGISGGFECLGSVGEQMRSSGGC